MAVKCEDYNHVCVMTPTGDFTADEAKIARKAVEARIVRKQLAGFILDCEKVGFIDSEGLATLLWMKQMVDELLGQLKLVNLDDNCRKILEITRLDHRFECHKDLASALRTMR